MAKKQPVINEADPNLIRQLQRKTAGDIIYPRATEITAPQTVTITQSVNNDSGDVVTVYRTEGEIQVTSIDQTVNQYTSVNSGVSQILAGDNITITSTNGSGKGIVTINSTGGGGGQGDEISNGTSNVAVELNGPVTVGVAGTANVVVIDDASLSVTGDISASGEGAFNSLLVGSGEGGNITGVNYLTANVFAGGVANIATINAITFNQTLVNVGNVSGTVSPDAALGTIFKYTLTGNITLNSITNAVPGTSITMILKQDSSGGKEIEASTWLWANINSTLTPGAEAVDIINVLYDGTDYYATLFNNFTS